MMHRFSYQSSVSRYILLDGMSLNPGEYVVTDAVVLPKLWGHVGRQRETHLTNNN